MKLSHLLPLRLRLWVSKQYRRYNFKKRINIISNKRNEESIFFVLNIPSHGNMGDQLIAFAIDKFIKDYLPSIKIESFTTGELECGIKCLSQIIKSQDIISITGGGFLGDIYPVEEKRFHEIMNLFPNNKIILFPQTFSYLENSSLLNEAISLQENCANLIISTRERRSFDFIKSHFNNAKVLLLPDITTYLNLSDISNKRSGILICSRNDKEKDKSSKMLFNEAIEYSKQNKICLSYIDTQVPHSVGYDTRNEEIKKLIENFSSAKLVITDRLHGMLYSIVTSTPVIAIDNTTKKISGAYNDWFKDLSYVQLATDKVSINNYIEQLYFMDNQKYVNAFYVEKLKELIEYAKS